MKSTPRFLCFLLVCLLLPHGAAAVELIDPRHAKERGAGDGAAVKLVSMEFEAVGSDPRAKQRAKDLHKEFLTRIQELRGRTVVSFVHPPGEKVDHFRKLAQGVAKREQAQMVLWGSILVDSDGTFLIRSRMMLNPPPPGVRTEYLKSPQIGAAGGTTVRGMIDAPVTQSRLDFGTMDNEILALVQFVSGVLRYYEATARAGGDAVPWLKGSIADFQSYLEVTSEKMDRSALSQARLYIARAYVRLADAEPAHAAEHLAAGGKEAGKAASLNPYTPDAPTLQAVISARTHVAFDQVEFYLARAARLAPTDANARVNLALVQSAQGKYADALHQLDQAAWVQQLQNQTPPPALLSLRQHLAAFGKTAQRTQSD